MLAPVPLTSKKLLRFCDLVDRNIVANRMTLKRWIDDQGFPPGFMLGPNSRAWPEDEVEAWIEARKVGAS